MSPGSVPSPQSHFPVPVAVAVQSRGGEDGGVRELGHDDDEYEPRWVNWLGIVLQRPGREDSDSDTGGSGSGSAGGSG